MLYIVTKPDAIPQFKTRIFELFEKINEQEHDLYAINIPELWEQLRACTKLLLVASTREDHIDSIAVIEFLVYGSKKSLRVLYAAGQTDEQWPHYIQQVEQLARRYSVDFIEVWGRKGWQKMLKPLGYEANVVNFIKRID